MKIDELRREITKLQQETCALTRELTLKYEECDSLNDEINNLKNIIKSNQIEKYNLNQSMNLMFNQSSIDNNKENLKLNNLENLVNNYGEMLLQIKQSYENSLIEHERKIQELNDEHNKKIQNLLNENNELRRKLVRSGIDANNNNNNIIINNEIGNDLNNNNNNINNNNNNINLGYDNFDEMNQQINMLKQNILNM